MAIRPTDEPRQREVRVFISSTFRDMHAERDHLVTVVFPELRERIEQLGLEFFDVDLRWGVPEKNSDGETANSWEYCRQWIDRVEPFFVCILGQRYGWVPAAKDFKSDEDKLRRESESRSITDLEVRHAVLDDRKKRRSYFYLRETEAPATATEYVDPPLLLGKLERLKRDVRSCGRPVRHYPCEWTGSGFTGMDDFGRQVLDDLWSGVLRDERYVSKDVWRQVLGVDPNADARYTDESEPVLRDLWEKIISLAEPEPKEPLEAEREQMAAFATARLRWFQGRTGELEKLVAFVSSTAENVPRVAVVAAEPGQGKSALLARLSTLISDPSNVLITHFVGATERSSSAHALVERLLGELDHSGVVWPTGQQEKGEEPKRDFNSLCLRLAQRLGDYTGERRIIILVDALNQLSDGHDLQWLPARLGPGLRVIVSCLEDAAAKADSPEQRVLHVLVSRQPAPLRISLGPLMEGDVRTIVIAYLKEYCHELDREHLDTLCAIAQARNPLYLLVMLNELRTLGGNDLNRIVPARIAAMSWDCPDTVSLFRWVLQRLEVFGPGAVKWWCLYLAHGRAGMASHELADLLARKLGADHSATALRIERGLRRYLQRRGPKLDFFHGQLRQAALKQYYSELNTGTIHIDIASYFHEQDNFLETPEEQRARLKLLEPTPRPANLRKVEELPYQRLLVLRAAKRSTPEFDNSCEALEYLLTNLFFLEAKTEAGLVFDLASEFAAAVDALPQVRPRRRILRLLEEALRRDVLFISRHPTTLFQCLWNLCWWDDCPAACGYYDVLDSGAPQGENAPAWANNQGKLFELLEHWHEEKQQSQPNFVWIRSARPPVTPIGGPQLKVLRGHDEWVYKAKISSDGSRIASGSHDRTVRLWNTDRGQELARTRTEKPVEAISFSPDGRKFASGSGDHTVRVFDAISGQELVILCGEEPVSDVSFSPDGSKLVSADGNAIRVWDTEIGTGVAVLRGHGEHVQTASFSPDGHKIVSASYGTVRLWDTATREQLLMLGGQGSEFVNVRFSPDGRRLAGGSRDGTVRIWDLDGGQELIVLRGHQGSVNETSFSPDGQKLATASSDHTVRVWNIENGLGLAIMRGHADWVGNVSFSPDGRKVASGSGDHTVRIWDAESGRELSVLRGHEHKITDVAFSPDGRTVVSCSFDKTIRIWDAESHNTLPVLREHEKAVHCVSFSPDGRRVVSGSQDNSVRLWEGDSGLQVATLTASNGGVTCACFSKDGKRVVIGCGDKSVRVWDVATKQELIKLWGHSGGEVSSVSFSPDGLRIASGGSYDQTVQVWDVSNGVILASLKHSNALTSLCFSPDGRRIAAGSWAGTVTVWELDEVGRKLLTLGPVSEGWVTNLVFSADGSTIACGFDDYGTVLVWDIATAKCLEVVRGPGDASSIIGGNWTHAYHAVSRGLETAIENVSQKTAIAWFEADIDSLRARPFGFGWAGSSDRHLYMIHLLGSIATR